MCVCECVYLDHKFRNDAVELGSGVAEALRAGAQGAEVGGSAGHDAVVQLELHAAHRLTLDLDIEVNVGHLCNNKLTD
jgi:hypothetical protein